MSLPACSTCPTCGGLHDPDAPNNCEETSSGSPDPWVLAIRGRGWEDDDEHRRTIMRRRVA